MGLYGESVYTEDDKARKQDHEDLKTKAKAEKVCDSKQEEKMLKSRVCVKMISRVIKKREYSNSW
jgi:hypothetical protein